MSTNMNIESKNPDSIVFNLYNNFRQVDDELPEQIPDISELPECDIKLSNFQQNDRGNARRLIERYGRDLIYVPEAGWYGWTGKCWSLEDGEAKAQIFAHKTADKIKYEALAKLAAGNYVAESSKDFRDRIKRFYGFALQSGNTPRLQAMTKEAQPYLKAHMREFDNDYLLVSVGNGTLDLNAKDGDGYVKLLKHKRNHKITKLMDVDYDASAEAPRFLKFMADIQPDPEIRNFLQRYFGYCLTGTIKEQVILMFYGGGANGKSTIMNLMNRILSEYALNLPFQSLLHDDRKRGGEASPDLARLPGARLVTASEPDQGARFSESLLKQLSGGEKMAVRRLHKDFFEFMPQFKLLLAFNNKPAIRGQDDGIWRRVCLVPFNQQFVPAHKLDEHPGAKPKIDGLEDMLWEERAGILNWMLDGYRMWKEGGLQMPDQVKAATSEYKNDSNPLGQFIEFAVKQGGIGIAAKELYRVYELWCGKNALKPFNANTFGRRLTDMGLKREKVGGYMVYAGVDLTEPAKELLYGSTNSKEKDEEEGGGYA
tara:strand:+ start:2171 stop:3793 length:1623 start_codon:yes stop_codon:yes gene_type:complete